MTAVLIVGAGPTGVTLANLLIQANVDVRIIDRDPGPTQQSRASMFHIRTLELWDRLGLARQIVQQGLKVTHFDVLSHGKNLASYNMVPDSSQEKSPTPFPHALAMPQGQLQTILCYAFTEAGGKIEWNKNLTDIKQTSSGVQATVECEDGTQETIMARWVVGADGSKSVVRSALNIPFEGDTYEQTPFLGDVDMISSLNPHHLTINITRGGFVGVLPLAINRVRLFGSLSPEMAAQSGVREGKEIPIEVLQRWFDSYFDVEAKITHAHWTGAYRVHRRLARNYRAGNCFLIGDAAHVHPPSGGQGLNMGVGDSFNLAWKLAAVVNGQASERLLDSYELERRRIAELILNGSDKGFDMEAGIQPHLQFFREHVMPRLVNVLSVTGLGELDIYKTFSQSWVNYRSSQIVMDTVSKSKKAGPRAGERAPHDLFETQEFKVHGLYEMLRGPEHHLLCFEGIDLDNTSFQEQVHALQDVIHLSKLDIKLIPISRENHRLHLRYSAHRPSFFLIRPDDYIAFRGQMENLAQFQHYLQATFTPASEKADAALLTPVTSQK